MLADRHPVLFYSMVFSTIVVGMLVAILPISPSYQVLRPELLCLIVIYWVLSVPMHLGVTFAFLVGLMQSFFEFSVWGAHALGLAVVAYICLSAYQRMVSYSVWHQTVWVGVLVGAHQVLVNWVQGFGGHQLDLGPLVLSVVVSALMWPPMQFVLRRIRQRLRLV